MKAWEKEKADGIELKFEDEEISGELLKLPKNNEDKIRSEEEVPAEPVPVIRY